MIQFKAFKAVLPNLDCFSKVPVLNPHLFPKENLYKESFVNIMNQDIKSAKIIYQDFLKNEYLHKENLAGYYLYQQEQKNHKFTGVIGLCSIKDFTTGKILPHEKTLPKREKQFLRYLKHNPIQAEPICLISENENLSDLIHQNTREKPLASFNKNGCIHQFWKLENSEKLKTIFSETDQLFIADGHHRLSSVALYQKRIETTKKDLLCFVIPNKNIGIFPYHRQIELSKLDQIKVENYLTKHEYKSIINAPSSLNENEVLISLNSVLYQKKFVSGTFVLDQINTTLFDQTLDLTHNKTIAKNLKFIPGEKSIPDLLLSNSSNVLQVFLPKVSFEQIKSFSKNHQFLPPKSTWILPKIPTGMCIYEM